MQRTPAANDFLARKESRGVDIGSVQVGLPSLALSRIGRLQSLTARMVRLEDVVAGRERHA